MVTRRMPVTEYNAMCVDTNAEMVVFKRGEIPGDYTNSKPELLKRLKSLYETEDIKYVNVVTVTSKSQRRGMSELEFFEKSINLEKEN